MLLSLQLQPRKWSWVIPQIEDTLSSHFEAEDLGKAVAEAAKILMNDEKLSELSSEEGSRVEEISA